MQAERRRPIVVAIDGPAGAGKSTVSKRLTGLLGYRLLDTGALYRSVALSAKRRGVSYADAAALAAIAAGLDIEFRPPSIVLAYPASDGALPADKPLIVFRFAAGDSNDPIDPTAFRATVDGVDRTSHFRVTPTEAWGQLTDSSATPSLTPGPHLVGARVCSVRGACQSVSARVEIRPWEQALHSMREWR